MRRIIVLTTVAAALAGAAMLDGPPLRAQGPQTDTPTFEVASVKPNKSGEGFVQLAAGAASSPSPTLRCV